jgi:hypothetical protein
MYINTKPARRGGPARQGGFTCRGRRNSLQEEQATACEDEKTNLGRDVVLRNKRQLVKTKKQISVEM